MIFIKNITKNSGFTLVELMVATTLFTIVMLMGVGSLILSSNSAKSSQKLRIAVDNVNFAMESMTRELRMGTNYYCGSDMNPSANRDCSFSGEAGHIITFKPQQIGSAPTRVGYFRDERIINGVRTGTYTLKRCEETSNNCADIVSSDVNVQTLDFYVTGSMLDDKIQPSVNILMSGVVKIKGVLTPFTLQSVASQRSSEK